MAPAARSTPVWATASLLLVSAVLVGLAASASQRVQVDGIWNAVTRYDGTASPDVESIHTLELAMPGVQERDGVTLTAARGSIALRTLGPIQGVAPVRVLLTGAQGAVLLDAVLDPSNPMSAPRGPPTARVGPGQYVLHVAPMGGSATPYTLLVDVALGAAAQAPPAPVPPAVLLGFAAFLAVVALLPLALRLRAAPPPSRPSALPGGPEP